MKYYQRSKVGKTLLMRSLHSISKDFPRTPSAYNVLEVSSVTIVNMKPSVVFTVVRMPLEVESFRV
jgi:hypothetical protein